MTATFPPPSLAAQVAERPSDSNADAWAVWLEEHADSSTAFKAVQIATALDVSEHRSRLLDRLQAPRVIWISEDHGVCVGGRFDGWLMWKHPDGQWVTVRKLMQERRPIDTSARDWRELAEERFREIERARAIIADFQARRDRVFSMLCAAQAELRRVRPNVYGALDKIDAAIATLERLAKEDGR